MARDVQRVPTTEVTRGGGVPDYTDAFQVAASRTDHRTPVQWLRAMLEDAPLPARVAMVAGWRVVLGFRLGPRPSDRHVLGWPIVDADAETARLQLDSRLLGGQLVLRHQPGTGTATFSTLGQFHHPAAPAVWAALGPIHRTVVPHLLARAAAQRRLPALVRFQRAVANPVSRRLAPYLPGQAVLRTTGRRTGRPHHTPVGGRLDGGSFWVVSEFGRRSDYVRNIEADPRVDVQLRGRWYPGTATVLTGDDARRRLRRLPRLSSLVVGLVGPDLLTLRIDLDAPPPGDARRA